MENILRRPLSSAIGLKRISPLVMALCRLHHFCINSSQNQSQSKSLDLLAQDEIGIAVNSNLDLSDTHDNPHSPVTAAKRLGTRPQFY